DRRKGWDGGVRRGSRSSPLEVVGVAPRVINGDDLAVAVGLEDVPQERQHGNSQDQGTDGGHLVVGRKAVGREVVRVTTRHTGVACPVLNQERGVEADEGQPEVQLAQTLVQHAVGHLREPAVHTSEGCEGNRAEQGVVEVRNHEVGVRQVEIHCRASQHDAGQTTEEEGGKEAQREHHRGFEGQATAPHGAEPVEELHTGRDCNQERHEGEERKQNRAGDEHVVCPHSHGQSSNGQGREDQTHVAEHRLAGEDREDLGDDAEERQSQDIDLRVAEEPEQVLPQDGATVARVVDVAAQLTVVQNTQCSSSQQREDKQDQQRGNEDIPGEDRHAEHGHTRSTQHQDGRDHVHAGKNGTDTTDTDTHDPQVRAQTRGVNSVCQWLVHGPAEVSRAARGEEAGQHQDTTGGGEPEAEGIQTREGHVRCTNLERNDVVSEAEHHRGAIQQQHDGAVHGEQLVELLRGQELHARVKQLKTNKQGHEATDKEEGEGHHQVHDAQQLM